ncbi:MAG: hypothetical protein EYC68_04410 [Chloroflexota bacterium]|nr:MAG: hypothetical protein EYC68_04410 [Chloroflexota bacterium]
MGISEPQHRIEALWRNRIREIRRVVLISQRELLQEEAELQNELATLRDSSCANEKIQYIEQTLRQRESLAQSELRQARIAYRTANIDLKFRGLDALLFQFDKRLDTLAAIASAYADTLEKRNLQVRRALSDSTDIKPISVPRLPEFDDSVYDTIHQVAGRGTDIDLLLHSLDDVLNDYTRRKRRRRIGFHGVRVLVFLGLVLLVDQLLNLFQPFEFYLLAAAIAWVLDEYFIRSKLEKKFEQWNVYELRQTITDFYRAQRSALYSRTALEKMLREAVAVLGTVET